jgi:hypothetical protein
VVGFPAAVLPKQHRAVLYMDQMVVVVRRVVVQAESAAAIDQEVVVAQAGLQPAAQQKGLEGMVD